MSLAENTDLCQVAQHVLAASLAELSAGVWPAFGPAEGPCAEAGQRPAPRSTAQALALAPQAHALPRAPTSAAAEGGTQEPAAVAPAALAPAALAPAAPAPAAAEAGQRVLGC